MRNGVVASGVHLVGRQKEDSALPLLHYLGWHTIRSTQPTSWEGPTSDRSLCLPRIHTTDFKWWEWKFGACHTFCPPIQFIGILMFPVMGLVPHRGGNTSLQLILPLENHISQNYRLSNILYYWRHRATADYKHFQLVQ